MIYMTKKLIQRQTVLYITLFINLKKLNIFYTTENAYFQETEFSLGNGHFVAMVLGKKLIFHATTIAPVLPMSPNYRTIILVCARSISFLLAKALMMPIGLLCSDSKFWFFILYGNIT